MISSAIMLHLVDGLIVEAPLGFQVDTTTVFLRAEVDGPRPSFLLHRRPAVKGASLDACVGEVAAELTAALRGASRIEREAFRYRDGVPGVLLTYSFASDAKPGRTVTQLQALRLDAATLTTATITTAPADLTPRRRGEYLEALTSVRVTGS